MKDFFTQNLVLAATLRVLGFSHHLTENSENGTFIFFYNLNEDARKEIEYWVALYYNDNLLVSPEKFLKSYKELKYMIYDKKNS